MAPLSALQRLVGLGCATSAATATRPATTRRGSDEELLNEPGDYAPWTLKGFLEDRGGNAALERARRAGDDVASRVRELGLIVGHFRGVGYVKSRWLLCEFVAVLVASGVSIQQLALPNINSLSPTMRGVLVLHYAPLLAAAAGPLLPEGHPCIQFFVTDVFENAGLKPALFRQFLLVIDLLYIACPTTGGDGAQLGARNVQAYSDQVHVAAGLDPIERGAAFLLIWRMLMKEGSYLGPLLAAGGAAFDFVATHLPDFQLLERCAHSQAMRRLGNLRGHLDDESKKGKKRSLGVPGPGLIASSTRAWTTLLTNVADGALDAAVTIFNNIFNRDPAAVEELRRRQSETGKARYVALPPLGKLLFHVRLGNCTFLGAINAWVALGASQDATARAAARALDAHVWRVVHTASRSLSLAAGAVVGAVVSAVAPRAASAPGLQLANTGVALALAPADAVEAPSSTFGFETVSPTPEVVMADASASTSGGAALEDVAPAPAAADGYESDGSLTLDQLRERLRQDAASSDDDSDDEDQDSFQAIAPDAEAEDVEEALQNAESEELAVSASELAVLERYLAEAVREDIFRPGLKNACSALCKAKYEPRHMRVKLGTELEIGDQAALLSVLEANSVDVKGLDPTKDAARLAAIDDDIWAAAEHAFYNTNVISFKQMLNALRAYHEDTKLSTLTLLNIFDTENPSLINAIPREEFIARVNDMKRKLGLPVTVKLTESELAARRAEWEAGTPMFKHDGCSVAFPKDNFYLHLFQHLSGHQPGKAGQPPTPVQRASHYCRSMTACTDCQTWVQKVAEGTASMETPGAGWVPSRVQVLRCAARVRAALPGITFGGVDLPGDDKLMGLTTDQAVGAIKHALAKCNSVGFTGCHMVAATYHSAFVPHFMAHLGLTDVNKVPAKSSLDAVYQAHKRKETDDKLMGLTTGQAVGAVKHALHQCNKRCVKGGLMDAATYHSSFVPHFMAHLGLTDVKKVPSQNTLQAIYMAHKRKQTDVAVEPASATRSKRARRAPK